MKDLLRKSKGRKAWLVAWEGDEFKSIDRPKVVAVFRPQLGQGNFQRILEVLYNSDYPLRLVEKVAFGLANKRERPRYFRYNHRDINPEMFYGDHHCFLRARQLKNLICEEDPRDFYRCTMTWTELRKYANFSDPDTEPKVTLEEREESYTYAPKRPKRGR